MSNVSTRDNNFAMPRSGWVSFAGYLMIMIGVFQAIAGLVAIFEPTLYIASENNLLALDYTQWGWTHLLIGVVLMFAAGALFAGRLWGRITAVILATLSAVVNFAFIWAYPIWSILLIAMNILMIYAIAMHGGEEEA